MSLDMLLALAVLAGTVVLLASGALRMDVVALVALVAVAVLGLAPPSRVVAGFSSSAVLAVAGMFVLSAGLSRTGVAELVGRRIVRMAGSGEVRLAVAITGVSGVLSGFMTNVGVAAMMLPVVVGIARKASIAPSKLLIPMALGAQLGGSLTLVGTTPNLIAADALRAAGLEPFGLFSFTPVGAILLAAGTILMATVGGRLLPTRVPRSPAGEVDRSGIREEVELSERLFHLHVPAHSLLDGRTLAESLLDSALGVHVLAIFREDRTVRAPGPETILRGGDRILVQGRPDFFLELRGRRHLVSRGEAAPSAWLESAEVGLVRARVRPGSPFVGHSAAELDLRASLGVLVLSLRRGEAFRRRTHLVDTPLEAGDELLIQGPRDRLTELTERTELEAFEPLDAEAAVQDFDLAERLWSLQVTRDSLLAGRSLSETRLGDAMGLTVLAVSRAGEGEGSTVHLLPGPDFGLSVGDHLLVKARPEDMVVLRGLQRLEVDLDAKVDPSILEGPEAGFLEAVLAPRSSLVGRTLRQASFRSRFGVHVVGIVREGGVIRTELRDEVLRFGDALLLYGSRRSHRALAREPDLILLKGPGGEEPEPRLAPLSILVTAAALLPVMLGLLPVAIGVLGGAALMVVTRCLPAEDAYRAIDWPTLVLIAGMLALGAALDETGVVALLGESLLQATGGFGPRAVLAALVFLAAAASPLLPATAIVVLLAPIGVAAGAFLEVSPYPFVMAVAISATSYASPVSHPALGLVMAPAGYRVADYMRLGLPLTLLVLVLTVLVTPVFFPF